MILAGEIADGETVYISADRGSITINGRANGQVEGVPDDKPAGTIVTFPKGA